MLHRALSQSVDGADHVDHEVEDPIAVLFPWFSLLVGIFLYYGISRYAHGIPYTAAIFVLGALLGHFSRASGNAVAASTMLWLGIDGEVIILSFLPGLLFLDSYNANVWLCRQACAQLLAFAFPMVLGGTVLTALVAYYVLPYGWSFDLCLTFGAILAATYPVAVAVLLNELGAPSRLKIHISGESLHGGSAVVFYHIFSMRFFYELGIEGFGEDIGWLRGLILFLRLSLGGMAIGVLFGIGLVTLLFNFNRRLLKEENVIQVTATMTIAYLSFFTSEIVCHCSGIIAVVFCGLTTKAFGETLLNDASLTHDFWHTTEHLLNTVLFALSGAVWATRLSSSSTVDWLYLALLFGMVILIRFTLIFSFYPVTSRMGIGQSWREAVFMSYGGLRGTVGIALALLLSAKVFKYTEPASTPEAIRDKYREFSDTLFGLVGGVSFLTLIVIGPTSGPLLKHLGLVTPTEARTKVILQYVRQMKQNTLVAYFTLLNEKRYQDVDFAVVKEYVSPLAQISAEELEASVAKYSRTTEKRPNLSSISHYISSSKISGSDQASPLQGFAKTTTPPIRNKNGAASRATHYDFSMRANVDTVVEHRKIFINLLRQEYHHQLRVGELDSRGFIPHCLLQSLDKADEAAAQGQPLNDWAASQMAENMFARKADWVLHAYRVGGLWNRRNSDRDFQFIRSGVLSALCFISAHLSAQTTFKAEFASVDENSLTLAEKTVLDESKDQVSRAEAAIRAFDTQDVQAIASQHVCQILLHASATYFEKLAAHGLMTEREAGEFLKKYDRELRKLRVLSELKTKIRKASTTRRIPTRIAPEYELGRLDEI